MKTTQPWFFQDAYTCPRMRSRVTGFLIGLVFFTGGIFALWQMAVSPALGWWHARSWVEVPATIKSASLESESDSDGTTYWVSVRFAYEFNERLLESDRAGFCKTKTNIGVEGMRRRVAALKSNPGTTCWVNPERPTEAVLDRSLPFGMVGGILFSIPFLTVGLCGLSWATIVPPAVRAIASRRRQVVAGLIDSGALAAPVGFGAGHFDEGTAIIFARDSAFARVLMLTGINLFWNGIVGVFVSVIISEFQSGKTEWFLILFMTPFVAVGGGIFFAWIQSLFSYFAPNFVAVVSPAPGGEGGEVRVSLVPLPWRGEFAAPLWRIRLAAFAARGNNGQPTKSFSSSTGTFAREFRPVTSQDKASKKPLEAVEIPAGEFSATVHLPALPDFNNPPLLRWWELEVLEENGRGRCFEIAGERGPAND